MMTTELHALLTSGGMSISLSTILHGHVMLGWTFRDCLQIRHQNKHKRFVWVANNDLEMPKNGFEDVILTNVTTM